MVEAGGSAETPSPRGFGLTSPCPDLLQRMTPAFSWRAFIRRGGPPVAAPSPWPFLGARRSPGAGWRRRCGARGTSADSAMLGRAGTGACPYERTRMALP